MGQQARLAIHCVIKSPESIDVLRKVYLLMQRIFRCFLLVCPVGKSPSSQMIRGMSEKLKKQESADVKENEILSEESLKLNQGCLFEDQRAKEESKELKLRYLNSFTGNSYPNYSYRQKVERLAADPHFDI